MCTNLVRAHICTVRPVAMFFCQAEDGIRDLVRSRGLGDVYKRQSIETRHTNDQVLLDDTRELVRSTKTGKWSPKGYCCLLYTSDAADERSSVDLGGRRIIKKKTKSD